MNTVNLTFLINKLFCLPILSQKNCNSVAQAAKVQRCIITLYRYLLQPTGNMPRIYLNDVQRHVVASLHWTKPHYNLLLTCLWYISIILWRGEALLSKATSSLQLSTSLASNLINNIICPKPVNQRAGITLANCKVMQFNSYSLYIILYALRVSNVYPIRKKEYLFLPLIPFWHVL